MAWVSPGLARGRPRWAYTAVEPSSNSLIAVLKAAAGGSDVVAAGVGVRTCGYAASQAFRLNPPASKFDARALMLASRL